MPRLYTTPNGDMAIINQQILDNMKTRLSIEFENELVFDDYDFLPDEDVRLILELLNLSYVGEL